MSDPTGADSTTPPLGEPTPQPVPQPDAPGASSAAPAAGPSAATPGPETAPGPEPEPEPKAESLIDAIADLLQMAVNYLRQETAGVMRDKVVLPGQQLGQLVAFAFAAAFLLALGIGFIAVAILLILAYYLTWPGALALIGGLLLIGAAVFTYLKVRSIQT
jgi:hypothetical protein